MSDTVKPDTSQSGDTVISSSNNNDSIKQSKSHKPRSSKHTSLRAKPSQSIDELTAEYNKKQANVESKDVNITRDDTTLNKRSRSDNTLNLIDNVKPPPIRIPKYKIFDNSAYQWKPNIDYRDNPTQYRVGKGEQGVLICEPYKSEICAHWRFKTPDIATVSSNKIYDMFLQYLDTDDFVGADMARKYLQMGFTRARRYTNYKSGLKYDKTSGVQLTKGTGEKQKAVSADIFFEKYKLAEANDKYAAMKKDWKSNYG